jgi:RNA polymerase sigma-70 factor, ECF subfamily
MDVTRSTGDASRWVNGSRPSIQARSDEATAPGRSSRGSGHDSRDRRAIAAAKRGDWDGIHYLYVRYADDVLAYVQSIVRDHHEAEDITQNVFAKLITAIKKYEEREVPFAAWIIRVARNATLDHLRARKQIPVEEVRTSDRGDDRLRHDRRRSLKEALAVLPEEQREVLVLRHVAGLSPAEIAERLGKTESSIHGLHHRGRATLKAALIDLEAAPVTARA